MRPEKLTIRDFLDKLIRDQQIAAQNSKHTINNRVRASLVCESPLLELIKIPRYQLKSNFSYIRVSEILKHFIKKFINFFMSDDFIVHHDDQFGLIINFKEFDKFIAYLKPGQPKV